MASPACGSSSDAVVDDTIDGSTVPPGNGEGGTTIGKDGEAPKTDAATTTGGIKTVFTIVMENHSWATVKNNAASTYIKTLIAEGAHAEAYSTPPNLHPSEPNYIWMEAGNNLGITDDAAPSANHQATKDHLTTQLDTAKVSWKAYAEDASGSACPLTKSGLYDPKHTPQLYFDDVTDTNKADSATCIAHVRPYSELAADLALPAKVARYNFITPNLCNDMHGNGFTGPCSLLNDNALIKLGNDWLAVEVPKIQASQSYKDGGIIIIVWDEGDAKGIPPKSSDGPIGLLIVGKNVKKGHTSMTAMDHSAYLRSMEKIFGVPFLRGAMTSPDFSDMFTAFP